ncbi:MAG TPA: hypothetical protein VGM54_13430 [Chthoniobacter sp.]|jgi:hypothetical protein
MKKFILSKLQLLLCIIALVASVASVHATGTDPIDFSTTGTTIGGYVTDAFAAAGAIFALIWGGKLMVKAFKAFGK